MPISKEKRFWRRYAFLRKCIKGFDLNLNGDWCYNSNVTFWNLWEEVQSATSTQEDVPTTAPPPMSQTRAVQTWATTLPLEVDTVGLQVRRSIGDLSLVNCRLSWWRWTKNWSSRWGRTRRLMTWKRRSSYCWPRTLTSWRRMRTLLNLSNRRTQKSTFGNASLILSTTTPTLLKLRRRRSSITSTSRTKNTRYKSKNYFHR